MSSLNGARYDARETYPVWKTVLLITSAVSLSMLVGISRFIVGAHSLDQTIFGWMLGAWIALSYFALVRDHVHAHVVDLMNGRSSSSRIVYFLTSSGIWVAMVLTLTIALLIVKDKPLNTNGENERIDEINETNPEYLQQVTNYDYWNTWSDSGVLGAGLGGYWGLLYQHKK